MAVGNRLFHMRLGYIYSIHVYVCMKHSAVPLFGVRLAVYIGELGMGSNGNLVCAPDCSKRMEGSLVFEN